MKDTLLQMLHFIQTCSVTSLEIGVIYFFFLPFKNVADYLFKGFKEST